MKRFAVSLLAVRVTSSPHGIDNYIQHGVGFVEAADEDAAKAAAVKYVKKKYPESLGWQSHGVSIAEVPTTP